MIDANPAHQASSDYGVEKFVFTPHGFVSTKVAIRGRSVDNDDDARWLAERLHRSFGSSVDVNPRFLGCLLLVISAGAVELSVAQHNAALGENRALQFCDSLSIGAIR